MKRKTDKTKLQQSEQTPEREFFSRQEKKGGGNQLGLFEKEKEHFDEFVFDEMNIVEIPFCTLNKKPGPKTTIQLSPTGREYLEVTDQGYGMPTALAEPTVLGLMWLTMDKNRFQSHKVEFELRELVENYMFPGQFTRYRANGRYLAAVKREIHRIASTRIHTQKWYDQGRKKHTPIDASIIDVIKEVNVGGRNSPWILEITWGDAIYESVRNRYTKALDIKKWIQIRQPLDRRLFRWLDRQLHDDKTVETVRSCQNWAKYKMLMQCYKLDKGGRTASNYVLTNVSRALERLGGLGFSVRLVADKSTPDFSFRFEKIEGPQNEVVAGDPIGDLVFEFKKVFHGAKRKGRVNDKERLLATQWIEAYGLEKALWMVKRCKELHRRGNQSDRVVHTFKGLEFYESAASGDYDQYLQEREGQLRLEFAQNRRKQWSKYREVMIEQAQEAIGSEEMEHLQGAAEKHAKESNPGAFMKGLESAMNVHIGIMVREELLKRSGAMSEDAFNAYETDELLEQALIDRHGSNPIEN